LGSAFALLLIIYATMVAFLQAEYGMSCDAGFKVDFLLPGGPAEQAGIQLGDRILMINEQPVDTWHLPITQWRPGHTLNVIIKRDSQRSVQPVQLTSPSWLRRMEVVTPLIVAFSFWIFSSLTLGSSWQSTKLRLFRAFSQVGSATLAAGNLTYGIGLVWAGHLFGILAGVLAPLILHFHLILPDTQLKRWQRLILLTTYVMGVIVVLPYLSLGLVSYWWRAGWGNRGARLLLSGVLLGCLTWISYSYVTTRSLELQRQLRLILLGTGLGFMPVLAFSLIPDLLGFAFAPYPLTMFFLIVIPLIYWYASTRFDLLRADLILNRSLIYLSVFIILGWVYFLSLRLIKQFLPDFMSSQQLIGILLLAMAGMMVIPLRDLSQRVINSAFYGGWYDYRSVVSDVSRGLTGKLDWRKLENLLLEHATNALWIRSAALLLPESHTSRRLVGRQRGALFVDPVCLSLEMDGSLARYLCQVHRPIERFWLQQEMKQKDLGPSESMLLDNETIRWWVPMVNESNLVGLLLLSTRTGDEWFDVDDLRILGTLGDQAALAIKNILLVETLHSKLKEIESNHRVLEQLHQRVLTGREQERKRLARELHDRPVQQLIAFRYQLGECVTQIDDLGLRRTLDELRDEVSGLTNELRRLCWELRPPLLDTFGLASAIRAYSEETGKRYGLKVQLVLDDDRQWQLQEEVAICLFRVYQEALSNVIKHANASQVVIQLYREGSRIMIEIKDDGAGFTVPDSIDQLAAQGQFGLLGIRERVEFLKGGVELTSQPNHGTILRIRLPIRLDEDS
jgi:two-component system sensor histidine kinase ComP